MGRIANLLAKIKNFFETGTYGERWGAYGISGFVSILIPLIFWSPFVLLNWDFSKSLIINGFFSIWFLISLIFSIYFYYQSGKMGYYWQKEDRRFWVLLVIVGCVLFFPFFGWDISELGDL